MTKPPLLVYQVAAAILWTISILCLAKAVGDGVTAEETQYNPHTPAADAGSIRQAQERADQWSSAGWILQFATAAVLALGLRFPRVVRRIFVSLGVLIAFDGMTLLIFAILIR